MDEKVRHNSLVPTGDPVVSDSSVFINEWVITINNGVPYAPAITDLKVRFIYDERNQDCLIVRYNRRDKGWVVTKTHHTTAKIGSHYEQRLIAKGYNYFVWQTNRYTVVTCQMSIKR